ncbi:MAG: hypothetical protein WCV90_07140 [Candidatus Woesearchaeota archaeon]|jgi:hypothetical protein
MNKELEDLEKQFILDGDMENEDLKTLIEKLLFFCKIDKNGYVIVDNGSTKKLTTPNGILLVLSARYLASKLQQKLGKESSIKEEVETQEIAQMLKEKPAIVTARLKDLKDQKLVVPVERGTFKIASYAIADLLNKLR